ncbi:homogentisate solanesyltransferase, chloroplastic-like [Morus notabilis]|uniref:homogentisate solanesyltransferase, chloroplastic-like n=2 Tax=Morus notabilis TaxID=981085 RepID=UPI000CED4DD8|nr:homogentisate solanesyltransferase, chloroplastic-like [Morus notabilis]
MEHTISHSSLRVSPFIAQRYKVSSQVNRLIPIKPTTKLDIKSSNFSSKSFANKLIHPEGLYGESRFSKSLLFARHNRNHSRASAKLEFAGSDLVFHENQPESTGPNLVAKVLRFGSIFYTFARPYTMIHVIISSICIFARVMLENKHLFKWSLLLKNFPGLIVMLLANVYFNGINQIFDADIDRTNKPYLPIPAGNLSLKQAWVLTIFSALGGQLILWLMNADLITTGLFWFCLLLATLYSAPPFRFKESSLATIISLPLMSTAHHAGVLYATIVSLGLPFQWSPPNVFIITYVALYFVAACLIKDIPDVEGDMKYNIRTFAAIVGPKNITILGMGILLVTFIGAIAAAIYLPQAFKGYSMLTGHLIFALLLLFQVRKLDKANYVQEASTNFYQFLWRLLSLEFLLFPFI